MRQLRLLAPALVLLPAARENPSTSPPFTFEAGPGPIPDAGGVDAADVFVPPVPKGVTVTLIDTVLARADRAAFFEATQLPSDKEAKAIPITPRATPDLISRSVALPINGTVRFTSWAPRPV